MTTSTKTSAANACAPTKRFFFLLGGAYSDPTAIEIQAYVRAKLFHHNFDITPTIITHGMNSYLRHDFNCHAQSTSEALDIPIYSIFDILCDTIDQPQQTNNQSIPWHSHLRYEVDQKQLDGYWVFNQDTLQMYMKYHPTTRLIHFVNHIEHHNGETIIIRRDTYNDNGYLYSTAMMNADGVENTFCLYDTRGRQRLSMHSDPKSPEHRITKAFVSNERGMTTHTLESREEIVALAMQTLADRYPDDELCFVIEHPIFYQALRYLEHPRCKIVSVFHAIQTLTPDVDNAAFHSHFAATLAELRTNPELTTIILSDEQKNDIENRVGHHKNLMVIPNILDAPPAPLRPIERNPLLLTALVRLHPTKQVDKMIEAFALVHKAIPEAQLDIYGVGELADSLQQQIDHLGLSAYVRLKGFTSDPFAAFAKAGLSLLTSSSEALPLVIMESLASGCPPVCFDIKYGPAALINDGVNGCLVPADNITAMAERIIETLSDNTVHQNMCHQARLSAKQFSSEQITQKWAELFDLGIDNRTLSS